MALTTNFNSSPYYDDADATKDYYRILFRPGFGVQARELTQLQTLLQLQLERSGLHTFQNGSRVFGADVTFDNSVKSLKLETNFTGSAINVHSFADKQIQGSTSGAQAKVVKVEIPTSTDQPTLMVQLLSANSFSDGETVTTIESSSFSANTVSATGASGIAGAQGSAALCSISEGAFFIDGFFVQNTKQTITVAKYASNPTKKIGMTVTESLVDSTTASDLLDNAQGTTNYAAPGANRLKLSLALSTKNYSSTDDVTLVSDENFIELIRVESGIVTKEVKFPLYAELEKTLARRTFDESGDYTVRPFGLQITDHTSNTSQFTAGIEPGKAYVKGYEFETVSTTPLHIDRARTTENVASFSLASGYGNKLFIKNAVGSYDTTRHELVDLHCVPTASVNALAGSANALISYNATKVGTARVRYIDWEQADIDSGNTSHYHSTFATSLYDIRTDQSISGEVHTGDGLSDVSINLPPHTTSFVNNAYTGATLVVNTTFGANTTSDTVTITDYKIFGGSHIATANIALSQNVRSNTTFTLTFTSKDIDSLIIPHSALDQASPANTTHVVITTSGDIDELSKYNFDPVGDTLITDTNRNLMLFPFPYSPIKTLPDGVTYQYKRFDQKSSNSIGGISFTTTTTGGSFLPGTKTLTASEAKENFIVSVKSSTVNDAVSGDPISNGQILDFSSGTGRSIEVSGSGSETVVIHCNTAGSITTEITSTVKVNQANPRTKTLTTANVSSIASPGVSDVTRGQIFIENPNNVAGQKDNLMVSDIFNLTKVVESQDNNTFPTVADIANSDKDITSRYTLDTGQRDNFYDHGSIILKPGQPSPSGRILVLIDYFTPDSDAGYFSIDSYSTIVSGSIGYNRNAAGTAQNTFSYSTIPSYVSPVTGEQFSLRDVLDFRPVRANANNASGANTVNDISSNTTSLAISVSADGGTPDLDGTFISNIEYYLGRTDKLVLTRDREFIVKNGVPSLDPITPADDEDSMTLYTLQVPAYTFSVSDIQTKYIDNRRFTMRDIGKLERRIENLEYYTSLSLLEKETAARDITGSGQTDSLFNPQGSRFKNGILVDPFKGHSIGDVSDEDYKASVDFDAEELRPKFNSDNFRFNFNSSNSTNITASANIATLSYTTTNFINQPLSSNTFVEVNPFNLVNYIGNLTLTPSSDTWYDIVNRADVLVNLEGINDGWQFGFSKNGHGSQWSDWTKIWSGDQINPDPSLSIRDLGSSQDSQKRAKLTSQVFTRTGIKNTNMPESIKRTIGNKVIDVSVIPFVRTQEIFYVAKGMKPSQNVFVYFDGVRANTTPASTINVTGIANDTIHYVSGEIITQGANTAEVLLASKTNSQAATLHIRVISSTGAATGAFSTGSITGGTSTVVGTISSRNTPTNTSQANTNLAGETSGMITIPAGTFRTGDRLVRLLDTSTHDISSSTTVAESRYSASGVLASRESGIVSTRLPISRREEVTKEQIYFDQSRRDTTTSNFINPLSQTFFVDKKQNPKGIFLNSVDLFFRQKHTSNTTTIQTPVSVQIRPVRNNLPSSNLIIPFSEKTLRPDEVNAQSANVPSTSNTSHSTTFTFDAPVYLPPDEYALCITSQSNEYQLYTAVEGNLATGTTRRITRQPNVGVLYESQNQLVPISDPERSIMFKANRCDFSSSSGTLVLSSNATSLSSNTANVFADVIKINTSVLEFANTSLTYSYRTTNTSGSTTASYSNVDVDQNVYLSNRIMFENAQASEMYLKSVISSSDSKVSPVIDIDRFNVVTIENDIDNGGLSNSDFYIANAGLNYNTSTTAVVSGGGTSNVATVTIQNNVSGAITGVTVTSPGSGYVSTPTITLSNTAIANGTGGVIQVVGETSNKGGNLNAKYLTRKVTLEDGFDASDIKIIINAYKPKTSQIFAYAKVKADEDAETLDDKNFFLLDQETPSSIFSLNTNDIKEFVFKTTNDSVSYTTGNIRYSKFKSFIVKIGMLSTDTTDPPRIKDLRAIALDE